MLVWTKSRKAEYNAHCQPTHSTGHKVAGGPLLDAYTLQSKRRAIRGKCALLLLMLFSRDIVPGFDSVAVRIIIMCHLCNEYKFLL